MKNDENSVNLSRRDFFKELGMIGGGGVLLSAFPWLQSCSADDKVQIAKEKVRIGFIGTGSRGQYHLNNLKTVPYADVVALCDNYPPNLKAASVIYPQAKTYDDYRKVLEDHIGSSQTIDNAAFFPKPFFQCFWKNAGIIKPSARKKHIFRPEGIGNFLQMLFAFTIHDQSFSFRKRKID